MGFAVIVTLQEEIGCLQTGNIPKIIKPNKQMCERDEATPSEDDTLEIDLRSLLTQSFRSVFTFAHTGNDEGSASNCETYYSLQILVTVATYRTQSPAHTRFLILSGTPSIAGLL